MAAFSNASSTIAGLRSLQMVNRDLDVTNARIASGLRVASAKDDPSAWAGAAAIRTEKSSLSAVQESLGTGATSIATAQAASTSVGTILSQIKTQLVAAKSGGADLAGIQSRIDTLNAQLRAAANGAAFAGQNLLAVDTSAANYTSARSIVSSVSRRLGGAASVNTINIQDKYTKLFDNGVAASGTLQRAFDPISVATGGAAPSTVGLDGTASAVAGSASTSPSTAGVAGTASTVTASTGTAKAAKVFVDFPSTAVFAPGDTMNVTLTLNGVTKTAKAYTRVMPSPPAAKTEMQRALDAEFGANVLVANFDGNGDMTIETVATGAAQNLSVGSIEVTDGDDRTTGNLNLLSDPGDNWVYNSEVVGRNTSSSIQRNINMTNIDRYDRIKLKIKSILPGTYSQPDQRYIANGTVETFEVMVSLTSVSDRGSLAGAINTALTNDASLKNYFGAEIGTERGNGPLQLMIYHKLDGASINVTEVTLVNGNGSAIGTPAYTATTTAGADAVTGASATTGSDFAGPVRLAGGAALSFNLAVNGATTAVTLNQATVEAALAADADYIAGSGVINTAAQYAAVVQRAVLNSGVSNIAVTASGARLRFTKTGTAVNGDTVNVSGASATAGGAASATLRAGTAFTGPQTIAQGARLQFDLTLDGGAAKAVSISRATVDAALAGESGYTVGSGTIANAAQFAKVVTRALGDAGVAGVTAANDRGKVVLTKTAGGAGSIAIGNVLGSAGGYAGSNIKLETIDIRSSAFADLDAVQRGTVLDALIAGVDQRAKAVVDVQSYLGSVAKRIDIQQSFLTGLDDIMTRRLGTLVDANATRETARKKALEARQGLILQSLQIANASQANVLQLFRKAS